MEGLGPNRGPHLPPPSRSKGSTRHLHVSTSVYFGFHPERYEAWFGPGRWLPLQSDWRPNEHASRIYHQVSSTKTRFMFHNYLFSPRDGGSNLLTGYQ